MAVVPIVMIVEVQIAAVVANGITIARTVRVVESGNHAERITVVGVVMTDRANHVEIGVTTVTVAMTDGTVETVVISRAASARTVEIGSHVENTVGMTGVMIDATTVAVTVTGVAVVGTRIVTTVIIGVVAVLVVTIAGTTIVVTRVAVRVGRTEAVGQSKNAIAVT
ncbi:hypothetical protein HMPREF0281_00501 [Corynebacterium ammoniagenes DSM 20306]|uniref:Uncharacterized protein n=1 Tax=Corynebacterium ammoniagenes DSM 20306 TaxID=649754 RepID=A0ABN0AHX0_CORAM|nr:hypothetical protein HMPREF0281_00501 [Corynebacterium ammoniagenes DSM 20306]